MTIRLLWAACKEIWRAFLSTKAMSKTSCLPNDSKTLQKRSAKLASEPRSILFSALLVIFYEYLMNKQMKRANRSKQKTDDRCSSLDLLVSLSQGLGTNFSLTWT